MTLDRKFFEEQLLEGLRDTFKQRVATIEGNEFTNGPDEARREFDNCIDAVQKTFDAGMAAIDAKFPAA